MTNVAFGSLNGIAGNTAQTTGTLSYSCTGLVSLGTSYVCLSLGAGSGGTDGSNRAMTSSSHVLDYQLYYNGPAGTGTAFPVGTAVAFPVSTNILGAVSGTITIYGNIPALPANTASGSYSSSFSGANAVFSTGLLSNCSSFNTNVPFSTTATIASSCTVSANALNFGTVSFLTSPVSHSTTINVTCTSGTTYTLSLGLGTGAGATLANRLMGDGHGHTLSYGLYQDNAFATIWGDSVGTNTLAGTGTGSAQSIPVYGKINAQATPPANNYTDSVVVTIAYN